MLTTTRTSIYHDNIDNVSEILAKFLNKYIDPHIINWWLNKNNNTTSVILRSKDIYFQRFVDAVTSRDFDPTQIKLTSNVRIYQQIFPDDMMLVNFMKFVLGLTHLLSDKSGNYGDFKLEEIYPFIGITYFVYNKIDHSSLLNFNYKNKAIILQDIRNLWSIFLYKKTNSHTNLNGEWDILIHEVRYPVLTDSRSIDLTPVFNIIDTGASRTPTILSAYIRNSLTKMLNYVISI
ncbi:hypothetical protein RhiirA5_406322 [Rhizophagus irregularis]|uniref:Uncharacterized protein n=1 Tax=Rhizophagus irregularis TaxID=588596 RepID=A0A2I1EAC7_9GLOM|nr:hypothetical protein RhiirA5_406322 [Rhizophagus irregularis]PKY19067.1 hypothetical protein RhiirB3_432030 [Rhizophagus irregularis]CAB5216643.1 unnamed protein product [Rhizophagus irregularis]CAB5352858.1 unnamed protein product [Rhizophagus irregularis]